MIEIHESYKGTFLAPAWFRPTVERLLKSLRPEHLGGLQSVVLTNSASIGRGKTRRVGVLALLNWLTRRSRLSVEPLGIFQLVRCG